MSELTPYLCVADGSVGHVELAVEGVDGLCARAAAAGATVDRGPEDSAPAGRVAVLRDPSATAGSSTDPRRVAPWPSCTT